MKIIEWIDLLVDMSASKKYCAHLTDETRRTKKEADRAIRRADLILALIP